jgi:hypothetical protein
MLFTDPRIILTARAGEGQKVYKFGDKVGEWQIVKFDSKTLTLSWHEKEVTKELAELVDNNPIAAPVQAAPPPVASTVTVLQNAPAKPSVDLGNSTKGCAPGDSSPNGTIADGMKKVIVAGPFGPSCHWEPVK